MSPRLLLSFTLATAVALSSTIAATRSPGFLTARERAQGYRTAIILAKPKPNQKASVEAAEVRDHVHVRRVFDRLGGVRVIELDAGDDADAAIARLKATGRYEFVERDYVRHEDNTMPADPLFTQQWALNNTGQQGTYTPGADIHAEAAWDTMHDAPDVVVAVVDSGVRVDHQDITPNLWTNSSPTFGDVHGASFLGGQQSANIADDNGHGTHVAGILAAAGNNLVAIAGVVWKTQLMILKNAGADGNSVDSDSAACIDYAIAHGAKVINCSFGGLGYSGTLYTAIKAARDAGVIVVCSAGNDGSDNDFSPHFPSNYLLDNIVAVGNSTPNDGPNSTSDYGNLVDLFAPGTSIVSLDYQSTTGTVTYTGTSMAAPHVTGALVLLRQRYPNDTYRDTINRLLNGADEVVALAARSATNGRLNLLNALSAPNHPFNNSAHLPSIITQAPVSIRTNNQWTGAAQAAIPTDDPPHVANSGAGALWWLWVAPASGNYVIDTSGSNYDTGLDVYTGTLPAPGAAPSSTLSVLTSNDDDGANKTSRVMFPATQGTYYFICTTSPHGSYGYTQLNISPAAPNDDFANAIELAGSSATATADNHVATLEPGEPAILGQNGAASVWYKWTAPRTAKFQISGFSYDCDVLMAVYTGTEVDKLTLVTADDDTDPGPGLANEDSRCTVNATAGVTYYIQVETKTADARGTITTTITDSTWQFSNDGGAFNSPPAVAEDGTLYIGAAFPDHRLYAINPDGTLKWAYSTDASVENAAPAIASDGTVYQGFDDGSVVALKPDGTVRWKQSLTTDGSISGGIAIALDGTLYLHASDGYIYALNPADGSTKWRYNAGMQDTFASAAIGADGTIYQGSDGNKMLYALNPDGTVKWQYATNGTTYSTPAIDAMGNIYMATYSTSTLLSVTPDGKARWAYQVTGSSNSISSSPVLNASGDTVYIGSADGNLHAVDSANGTQRWTYPCADAIYSCSPAVDSNGVIYVGAYDGHLYAINSTGALKRTWATAQRIRSSPLIYGSQLYVGSNDAKLYAFDIGAALASGPWPEYRHDGRRLGRVASDALAIVTAPVPETVKAGDAISLDVVATGADPLAYQWKKDGTAIAGATSAAYSVPSAAAGDGGSYTVTVSGPQGSISSAPVTVAVITPNSNPGRLTNLSIRSQAGTGSQTLIVGLSIRAGSNGNKPLLIRGVGPTLAGFGVTGAIPDPVLTVYQDKTVIQTNSGWGGDAQIASVGSALGAFPFSSTTSLDSALYTTLPPAGYTIQLTGKTDTGVALVEVYDATPAGTFTTSSARLTNVSARTQVGTGGDVLIAGFAVGGTTPEHLLIRAVGPKLADFGVTGVLADPQLVIYADKTMIGSNDNWGGGKDIADASSSVGAFALDPNSKDAVLVLTLQPGTYSAVVSGVGDTTGVALVELYELP